MFRKGSGLLRTDDDGIPLKNPPSSFHFFWAAQIPFVDRRRESVRKKSNFTQRCIQEIESIPILQIARDFGMELKRSGREYKVPGNGGLTLNPEKNCWYCFTLDEKVAKGPIGFVEYITGYGFRETVKLLADMYRVPLEQEEMEYEKLYREKRTQIVQEKEKNIILPKKGTTCRHLFAYLCKTRKVGREVVEYFLKAGRLYENDLHSCVFVGLDPKGKPRHCAIRDRKSVV